MDEKYHLIIVLMCISLMTNALYIFSYAVDGRFHLCKVPFSSYL